MDIDVRWVDSTESLVWLIDFCLVQVQKRRVRRVRRLSLEQTCSLLTGLGETSRVKHLGPSLAVPETSLDTLRCHGMMQSVGPMRGLVLRNMPGSSRGLDRMSVRACRMQLAERYDEWLGWHGGLTAGFQNGLAASLRGASRLL